MDNVASSMPSAIDNEETASTSAPNTELELNHIDVHSIVKSNESAPRQEDTTIVQANRNGAAVISVDSNDAERNGIEVSLVIVDVFTLDEMWSLCLNDGK